MTYPKLHIVGIGANGIDSLSPKVKSLVQSAPIIYTSERIAHIYTASKGQDVHIWKRPFSTNMDCIQDSLHTHKILVILATGDGNWFGPSKMCIKAFGTDTVVLHPNIGAYQLALSTLQWAMQDCTFTSVHGKNVRRIIPHLHNKAKLCVLANNKQSALDIATLLCEMGLQNSTLHILSDLDTPTQTVDTHMAQSICCARYTAPSDLNTIAIDCVGTTPSLTGGVPDALYTHNGQITKSPVRAITMSALQPRPHAVLWDIGAGCGSISVEWCRLGGIAHAFEKSQQACTIIQKNADTFGVHVHTHNIHVQGTPHTDTLPHPDCIFIGGGISHIDIQACIKILPTQGRLVVNTVTLEGESIILDTHKKYGGQIQKISITQTVDTQNFHRWDARIPVCQYTFIKE